MKSAGAAATGLPSTHWQIQNMREVQGLVCRKRQIVAISQALPIKGFTSIWLRRRLAPSPGQGRTPAMRLSQRSRLPIWRLCVLDEPSRVA